jgi:hypothetical protein
VWQILPWELQQRTRVVTGPLSAELLETAWFGITLESTTVIDCTSRGVPCFLAGWLAVSPYGYVQQYADFGIGILLNSPDELAAIPKLLAGSASKSQTGVWELMRSERLQAVLARESRENRPTTA